MKTFYEKYLCLNLKDYGFGIDFEINKILIILFVGLCIACFFVNYNQSNLALVLRKLIRSGAIGESNAKTLSELGLSSSKPVKKLLLKSGGPMKSIISYVGEVKLTYEEYIANEKAARAAKKTIKKSGVKRASKASDNAENTTPPATFDENTQEAEARETSAPLANYDNSYRIDNSQETVKGSSNQAPVPSETEAANENAGEVNTATEEPRVAAPSETLTEAPSKSTAEIDFTCAKFFIREEKKEAAMRAFSKNNGSLVKTALSCVLLLGFCTALIFLMPSILSAVKGILG